MRRGLTLIELLLSLAIIVVVTAASSRALSLGLSYNKKLSSGRAELEKRLDFEDRIRDLLSHAWIDSDLTNTYSYFELGVSTQASTLSSSTSSTLSSSASGSNDSVVFTIAGNHLPSTVINSTTDFQTNNETYGPVGGVSEVSLSLTAVGQQGSGKSGLFLRTQTPADADTTQGGNETLLSADVSTITFEAYDGSTWATTWDTNGTTGRRLPAAVRVTYRFTGEDTDRIFVVRIPSSDVTTSNPISSTGSSQ